MKPRIRIVLALACALLAVLCAQTYADAQRAAAQREQVSLEAMPGEKLIEVLVAREKLSAGDILTKEQLELKRFPKSLLPAAYFTTFNELQEPFVSAPVEVGSILTPAMLESTQATLEIPAGYIGLSIPLSDYLGISKQLPQGTRLSAYSIQGRDSVSLLSSDIRLLNELTDSLASASTAQFLSLAVPQEQASDVLLAAASGTLRFMTPSMAEEGEKAGSNGGSMAAGAGGEQAGTGLSGAQAAADGRAPQELTDEAAQHAAGQDEESSDKTSSPQAEAAENPAADSVDRQS